MIAQINITELSLFSLNDHLEEKAVKTGSEVVRLREMYQPRRPAITISKLAIPTVIAHAGIANDVTVTSGFMVVVVSFVSLTGTVGDVAFRKGNDAVQLTNVGIIVLLNTSGIGVVAMIAVTLVVAVVASVVILTHILDVIATDGLFTAETPIPKGAQERATYN